MFIPARLYSLVALMNTTCTPDRVRGTAFPHPKGWKCLFAIARMAAGVWDPHNLAVRVDRLVILAFRSTCWDSNKVARMS